MLKSMIMYTLTGGPKNRVHYRIRRINPAWNGEFIRVQPLEQPADKAGTATSKTKKAGNWSHKVSGVALWAGTQQKRQHAQSLRWKVKQNIEDWIHDPEKATALAFAMILEDEPPIRQRELDAVRDFSDVPNRDLIEEGYNLLEDFSRLERYEILELALGAIRTGEQETVENLPARLTTMAEADQKVTLREYFVLYIVRRHLKGRQKPDSLLEQRGSPKSYAEPISSILSSLASLQSASEAEAEQAFNKGVTPAYMFNQFVEFKPIETLNSEFIMQHLDSLSRSKFAIRRQILDSAVRIVRHNLKVSDEEAAILKLISAALGCPMPPL